MDYFGNFAKYPNEMLIKTATHLQRLPLPFEGLFHPLQLDLQSGGRTGVLVVETGAPLYKQHNINYKMLYVYRAKR